MTENRSKWIWGKTIPRGPESWKKAISLERLKISSFRLKIQVFAWNFQSRLKTSISLESFNPGLRNRPQNRGLVGGSLEIFNLAWKFQSRRAILNFFKIWALWVCNLRGHLQRCQMPDIENSRKTAENGAEWVTVKQPKNSRKNSRLFFGCFQCRAFGTSVGGRGDCKSGLKSPELASAVSHGSWGKKHLTIFLWIWNEQRHFIWEKLDRGVSKPGFPTFFGKGPDCVADPFGTVPRRCS